MRCPFLKEAQVRFCQAAPIRKMIVQSPEASGAERCSSPAFRDCPSALRPGEEQPEGPRCPFLQTSLVQYCSAAAITKYIPYSESLLSRCGTGNHLYCELYLGMAHPAGSEGTQEADDSGGENTVEDIPLSSGLAYSPNHMWLDVSADGTCHVGVDALFARVVGQVDRISFVPTKGVSRPSAVVSACGVDLQMIFPNHMLVTRTNETLRVHPDKLVSHPYSLGWLFEGEVRAEGHSPEGKISEGLVRGKAALNWMRMELERISRFIHERCTVTGFQGESLMMDGGTVRPGLMRHLNREEVLALFNDFFAFYTIWRN